LVLKKSNFLLTTITIRYAISVIKLKWNQVSWPL